MYAAIPALGQWTQKDEEFKVIFNYRGNWRLAWATETLSKRKKNDIINMKGQRVRKRRGENSCAQHNFPSQQTREQASPRPPLFLHIALPGKFVIF